jgi:hypothetical protein
MLSDKEIASVLKLDSRKRYPYLLKRVADKSRLFVLDNSGWCLMGCNTGNMHLPIWPALEFAKLYAVNEWSCYEPMEIDIHHFIDNSSIGLKEKNINIVPFPVIGSPDVSVSLDDFIENLQFELNKFE